MTNSISSESSNTSSRAKMFKIFFVALLAVAVVYGVYVLIFKMHYESTDNAYVSAPQLQISSQVEGTISAVLIGETQEVKAGDLLFRVDTTEAKIASEVADANLLKTVREVRASILMVQERQHELDRATKDYQRRVSLTGVAAYSSEELSHYKSQLNVAKTAYSQAFESASGITNLDRIDSHPDVMRMQGLAKESYVSLLRANVQAPVNAIVARRNAQVGQRVAPGTPLATLVLKDFMWVEANFKESQLAKIRIGQPVELEADVYGGKINYKGTVIGFAPGTGSSLAVLPAQNATGNWVKVVQRLPVRIQIDPEMLKKFPLKVGLTMTATVNVQDTAGIPLQSMQSNEEIKTSLYDEQAALASAHVKKLLHQTSN